MPDLILYRNEWYGVSEYHKGYVILVDEIGNNFKIEDKDIETPSLGRYYA